MFKMRRFILIMAAAAAMGAALFFTTSLLGQAASNSIPAKRLDLVTRAKLIADYRPAGCAGMTLTNIVYCTGITNCIGTAQNDLLLGDTENNDIHGGNGNDCIVSGGGDDTVTGDKGTNICIEGPGKDSYKKCTVVNP